MGRILIVDDKLASLYSKALEGTGLDVMVAGNRADAYRLLESNGITKVSLDNYFPAVEGGEIEELGSDVAAYIRSLHSDMEIIGLSAVPRFREEYFDKIFNKNSIAPREYREVVSGVKEPLSGNKVVVASEDKPLAWTLGNFIRSLGFDTTIITDYKTVEERRSEYENTRVILAENEWPFVRALWGLREVRGHDLVSTGMSPIMAPRLITFGLNDSKREYHVKMPTPDQLIKISDMLERHR